MQSTLLSRLGLYLRPIFRPYDTVNHLPGPINYEVTPYFSTPAESLCDEKFDDLFLSTTPPETEEVNVNLDAMTPAELTAFINEKEKAHKDAVKAMRALLRAKIALTPKSQTSEANTVG